MKMYRFYMLFISLMGRGCLKDVGEEIKVLGYKKVLIVIDKILVKIGLVKKVIDILDDVNISYVIFDEIKFNLIVKNVEDGLKMLKGNNCDFIILIGGGLLYDCVKGIGFVVINGGLIKDYEGVNKVCKLMFFFVVINIIVGMGSEVIRFVIIIDEDWYVKMVIVDWYVILLIVVNDLEFMIEMLKLLIAVIGMDVLIYVIEVYLFIDVILVIDVLVLMVIELIFKYLKKVVENGNDIEVREKMAYVEYLVGVVFNNVGLGYVYVMVY